MNPSSIPLEREKAAPPVLEKAARPWGRIPTIASVRRYCKHFIIGLCLYLWLLAVVVVLDEALRIILEVAR